MNLIVIGNITQQSIYIYIHINEMLGYSVFHKKRTHTQFMLAEAFFEPGGPFS